MRIRFLTPVFLRLQVRVNGVGWHRRADHVSLYFSFATLSTVSHSTGAKPASDHR